MLKIKKIWISPYSLIEKKSRTQHKGILLKILFLNQIIGYTSFHPFSQFKEGSLSDYLPLLKDLTFLQKPKLSSFEKLLKLCFQFAYLDGSYRNKRQSLLFGFPPLENHQLILDLYSYTSFDHLNAQIFKIKMKNIEKDTFHLKKIIENTNRPLSLRLDFNARLNQKEWLEWKSQNKKLFSLIDFIEDPFPSPFLCEVPIASDWEPLLYALIKIIKPTRHSVQELHQKIAQGNFKRVIFTHTLTHPLEARLSWVLASRFYQIHTQKKEVCGLDYPLNLYEKNDFSHYFLKDQFYSPHGTGLGFDSVLERQQWLEL